MAQKIDLPNIPQPIGRVQITLLSDGTVHAQCQVASKAHLLGMLEQAKLELYEKLSRPATIEIAGAMQAPAAA